MNEIIIMSIPGAEKPWVLYDKTLRRSVNNQSYKTYEEAKKALKPFLKMGYSTKEENPDSTEEFKKMFNKFKNRFGKSNDQNRF